MTKNDFYDDVGEYTSKLITAIKAYRSDNPMLNKLLLYRLNEDMLYKHFSPDNQFEKILDSSENVTKQHEILDSIILDLKQIQKEHSQKKSRMFMSFLDFSLSFKKYPELKNENYKKTFEEEWSKVFNEKFKTKILSSLKIDSFPKYSLERTTVRVLPSEDGNSLELFVFLSWLGFDKDETISEASKARLSFEKAFLKAFPEAEITRKATEKHGHYFRNEILEEDSRLVIMFKKNLKTG